MTTQAAMKAAMKFAEENLPELASELCEWKRTGLLMGGSGGKFREMAAMIPLNERIVIAEHIVTDLALEQVAKAWRK